MKYSAAYMLLALGGNASPSADDVRGVLSAGGVEVDDEKLQAFMEKMEGKDLDECIKAGKAKMKAIAGSAGGGSGGAASGGAAGGAAKEEEKEEEEEEEIDVGGGGLFGGDAAAGY